MKRILLKIFLLSTVSLLFLSCSNIFSSDSSSENSQKETTSLEAHKYVTITGTISLPEELTESGALPEDYLFIHNVTNTIQNRSAFPATPTSTDYYVTATATGETTINVTPTETESGATFSITLPVRDTEKEWSIEAGLKASFNNSTVVILRDACSVTISSTSPTFNHNFVIKPLETGNGNVELTMSFQSSNAADELELYFDNTKITAGTGETISPTNITLKNRPAGAYKAKLVFKKNGYVVFSDYEGINIFPNMTTNTWHHNGGNGSSEPIDYISGKWMYYVTNASIASYMLTQIYVGSTTVGGTTITASDTTGNGTVFAPFATFAKAIDYLQKNGDTSKAFTIWISGEITGAQTISDGTTEAPTPVKASSLTISGVTGNTSDSLKGGDSGSVLYLDTSKPVKITNLTITGGKGTTVDSKLYGGGIYINKGSVELTTGVVVDGNTANVGGGVYLVDGTLYLNDSAVVGKPLSALGANPTCAGTTSGTYANMATQSGGGIGVYEGTLWLGYRPPAQNETGAQEVSNTTGGVIYNLVAGTVETHGGGIDNNHGTLNIAHGFVSYNYAFCESGYNKDGCGGGVTTADAMYLLGDATISHNESAYGGAVYISKGRDGRHGYFTMSGGSIESNASKKQNGIDGDGGGIAIGASGSFEMSGGTIKLNTAENRGGAIFHNGSLCKISGGTNCTATIPKGDGTNNIFLINNGQTITLEGSTGHTGTGAIAVTAQAASRGLVVLTGDSTIVANNYSKFAVTNPGMKLVNTGKLDLANIIKTINIKPGETVAANYFEPTGNTNADSTWNNSTIALNASSTQSKPFKYLSTALKFITYQNSNEDYVIVIDGMLTGHQEIQNNSDTNNPITLTKGTNIKSLTIKGKTGSSTDGFNGNSTNSGTLYTKTDVPLTFESLVIKGGASTGGYAGGLQIDNIDDDHKADVTISTGVEISDNTYSGSSSCPGGIKNYGILKLAAGVFKGNTGQYGGAIYNLGTIYMYGSTIIGDTSKTSPADSSNKSNKAGYGGGIYNGGDLYVGYKPPVSTAPTVPVPDDDFSGGIYYNYATYKGGAIGSNSSSRIFIYKGTIKCNSSPEGGGIQVYGYASNSKCELSVAGGTFTNNSASTAGGAINVEEYGVFNCEGATSIESTGQKNNDVYLGKGTFYAKVNITNEMTGTVALTPSLYNTTPVYLSEGSTGLMKANFTHFKVNDNNTSDTTSWTIKYDGKLSYGISASKAATDIPSLSGTTNTITIAGYVTKDEMTAIRTSLATLIENDNTARVKLDLSGCIFPEGLPSSTFYNCANLTEVILPEGLTAIPDWIFSGCANLTSATLPSTITSIGERPFQSCNCDVTLDSSCTAYKIENGALYTIDGKSLVAYVDTQATSFTIPSSVETIVADAFDSSTHLQTITFAANSNIQTISWGAFLNCSGLTSITFPAKAGLALGTSICNGCSSLENVVIPNNWTTIPQDMFWSCSHLKTIVIPVTVRSVESGVTNHCYALETIKYRGTETQFGSITVNSNNNEKFNAAAKVYNYTGN